LLPTPYDKAQQDAASRPPGRHSSSAELSTKGDFIMKHVALSTLSIALVLACGAALAQAAAPNDAQIAGIVVAANMVDIDAGQLAEQRSGNDKVKQFARQMVTDHTGVNKQASALVEKLKFRPEESATSKSLKDAGAANMSRLNALKG
jgi:putative membrane protein